MIIIRDDTALPAWHLLADSASADYVWTCLVDAMQEFGGKQAGSDALVDALTDHQNAREQG